MKSSRKEDQCMSQSVRVLCACMKCWLGIFATDRQNSVQFSSGPCPIWSSGDWVGGMMDDSAEILFQSFLLEVLVSGSGMGRDVHSLMSSIQHWGALKDGFGEAVVACDIPRLCNLPSLDSYQNRILRTHKEVDLARTQSLVLCSK